MKKSAFVAYIISSVALLFAVNMAYGYANNDEYTRLNPVLSDEDRSSTPLTDQYPFLRNDLNHIEMNGADWSELSKRLSLSVGDTNVFTIIHIGDSHIQAEGNTSVVREHFHKKYGNAGRGLIVPYKLAGTNQPLDYKITSDAPFDKATLMRQPWPLKMGFTGISVASQNENFNITLNSPDSFDIIKVFGNPGLVIKDVLSNGKQIAFDVVTGAGGSEISLGEQVSDLTLCLKGKNNEIHGFELTKRGAHGTMYHAIGNNGATFSSYNGINGFAASLSALKPDLIIVSLGTNEAFGRFNEDSFMAQLSAMLRELRETLPEGAILLTTPAECQKATYTKGRGRSKKTRRVKNYRVNNNVVTVRDCILRFGKEHKVPIYDFYAVAGGEGSSSKWLATNLLNRDRIHRTWAGYGVEGELLYEALDRALDINKESLRKKK